MNKTIYNPKIFEQENIENAKKIILTKEDNLETKERWETETPFLVDEIIKKLQLNKNMTILDYGCGIGRIAKELILKTSCKVIGVDISESMRKMAVEYVDNKNFKVLSPNDFEINIKNGERLDGAYSIWVLQHCLDPRLDVDMIKKSLKKDTIFYVLNNKMSAVPTNKGWKNNGINIHNLLKLKFEEIEENVLPNEISSKKISNLTFISILKNSKGFRKLSSNKQVLVLLNDAFSKYKLNDLKTSKELYLKVLEIEVNNEEATGNLGVISKALGEYEEAINYYIKAIKLNPNNALTYNNLGNVFKVIKDYKRAILAFSDCIRIDPRNANAYNNLGMAYESTGNNNKAIASYKEAVKINPKFAKAVNNIGVILYKQKKYQEAVEIFKIALKIDPEYNELYSNIGACYNKDKKYDEAIESLNIAIEKNPKNGGAYTNLGNVYNKIFDYKKAAKLHEKSIELEPNGANAYSNVGTSYKYLGQVQKSINSYKKAIELDPGFVNAHFDLATMYLALGDFKLGFDEYEWRFKKEEMFSHIIKNKDIFSKPMFKGTKNLEELKSKTILLHSEQGFGDSIQFIRFLPNFKKKFPCKIAVKCRDELKELFKCIDEIDILTNRSESTPKFDYHLPIMSMPKLLNMKTSKDLPQQYPYLFANKDNKFQIESKKGHLNIGICWSASVTGESYDGKVFDLKYFEPFLNNDKITLYSLQVGPENEDIKKLGFEDKIVDLTSKLTDFSKTATLMKELDLVISSDTSVAHLAGALNVPVWIPLQKIPDWRWGNKGETSPWYPSAKLFRQKSARSWESVFQSIYAKIFSNFKIKIK